MLGPVLSPDGHTVAFSSPVDGVVQVFIMLLSGSEPLQLTKGEGDKWIATFSYDGTQIYFTQSIRSEETWTIPILGGNATRLLSGYVWRESADGKFYYGKGSGNTLFRSEKSGLHEEVIYRFDKPLMYFGWVGPYPEKDKLLIAAYEPDGDNSHLYKLDILDKQIQEIGSIPTTDLSRLPVSENGDVVFERSVDGIVNLWKYNLSDHSLFQITFGPGPDIWPMLDPNGKGIYYVNGKASGPLIRYSTRTRSSRDIIVSAFVIAPNLSPDARKLMYQKMLGDRPPEMWISDIDGSNARKITSGDIVSFDWAPDSSWISYNNSDKIYICRPDGSDLRQVGSVDGSVGAILWSADSRTLYVSTTILATGIHGLWKVSVDGTQGELMKADTIYPLDLSPDGRYVFGTTRIGFHIVQLSVATKEETMLLPDVSTSMIRVSEDGKSFFYAIEGGKETMFYRQGWENGKLIGKPEVAMEVPFTLFSEIEEKNAYDFSPDLSTIVYVKPTQQADLYLLSYSK